MSLYLSLKTAVVRVAVAGCIVLSTLTAGAQEIHINEIFFNQPSQRNNPGGDPFTAPDATHSYIELRGAPGALLQNTYLLFLENEAMADPDVHDAGTIELMFDLGAYSLGANGFLTIQQKVGANPQYNDYVVNPMATNLRNTGAGPGFGSGESSSIGAWSFNGSTGTATGEFEGSGFTALLIRTDGQPSSVPVLSTDLDVDNTGGFDVPGGNAGWTTLDSIAVFGESDEAEFGRTYAPLTFGFDPPSFVTWLQPGQEYVYLAEFPDREEEAEYIGRWGNSTGHHRDDWHVSNVTDRVNPAGFTNTGDFRQASDPHGANGDQQLQSSHRVPYGTPITTTLGSPNYPLNVGDFDANGIVELADFSLWSSLFADGGFDGNVFLAWQQNIGMPTMVAAAAQGVPEPSPVILFGAVAMVAVAHRRGLPPVRCGG